MLKRLPLAPKMILLTLLVGAAAWYPLDVMHTRELRELFFSQLMRQLEIQAQEDRLFFDQYIRAHHQATRFYSAHHRMTRYLDQVDLEGWPNGEEPRITDEIPPWFPRASVLRIFPLPRFALLIDLSQRVREVYRTGSEATPPELLNPGALMAKLSHSGALMTTVSGIPYLLSYDSIRGDDGTFRGALILATPLDSELLQTSLRYVRPDHVTLLVKNGNAIASSRPEMLAPGTPLEGITATHVITGKSFFDYDISDLYVEFATVKSTQEVEALSRTVLQRERYQRTITALVLIGGFLALTLWISRYVRSVTREILAFSRSTLGVEPKNRQNGDELAVLADQFHALEEEVVRSREELSQVVVERTRSQLEAAQQARTLALLREVTDALEVGVLHIGPDGESDPLNQLMESFIGHCGIRHLLSPPEPGAEEWEVTCGDDRRVFRLHRPVVEYVLVREVTGEREVRRRLQLALDVIENSTQGMFVADADGAILLINPAVTQLTGLDEAEVQRRALRHLPLLSEDTASRSSIQADLQRSGSWEGEIASLSTGGSRRFLWVRIDAVKDAQHRVTHHVGILSDVTDRHRAQEQLAQYAEELRQANEEVKGFAYIVSHDLRAPLVNIKGFVGELRHTLEYMQPTIQGLLPTLDSGNQQRFRDACSDIPEALDFIDTSVKKMDGLIQAILSLSRVGRRELHPQRIDTGTLVGEQIDALRYQIEQQGCRVQISPLPAVVADRTALEQVFGNLLANAVKYLDRNRPGCIEVFAVEEAGQCCFHVRDNGRGIARGDFPKVFAIFRRAGPQDVPGEGLGLAFVQALVRRHGGRIWFESEPDVGSTFSFTLPRTLPTELLRGEQEHAAA